MIERRSERLIAYTVLIVGSLVALYPLVSILLLALHEPGIRVSGFSFPASPDVGNFVIAWRQGLFASALTSSLLVAVSVVLFASLASVLAGYAFGTMRFAGQNLLFAGLLVGLVLPYEAMVIPLYYSMRSYGLLDTHLALILPQVGLSVSFGTFWMRAAFQSVPRVLIEAAQVDGAATRHVLWRVLLPQVRPAVMTMGLLLFMFTWNEFLLALVLVQDASVRTAPLALAFFAGNQRTGEPGVIAAAAVIVAIPIVVFYVILQRHFIRGMITGAGKE